MKALSFRQPWAELVLRGAKSMDLRTYSVAYRGPLALHAAKKLDREACDRLGLSAEGLTTGAVVGVVELVDVVELDKPAYEAWKDRHLASRRFRTPQYGWVFEAPRRTVKPFPVAGKRRLFDVELPEILLPGTPQDMDEALADDLQPFELHVVPRDTGSDADSGYGLALYQRDIESDAQRRLLYVQGPGEGMHKVIELPPAQLRLSAGEVMRLLREAGYRPTDLSRGRRRPFDLPEEVGVRMGLLFLAVRPLSKGRRIDAITHQLAAMPAEEAYYWYSKCAYGRAAPRAQKALRVLLAEE